MFRPIHRTEASIQLDHFPDSFIALSLNARKQGGCLLHQFGYLLPDVLPLDAVLLALVGEVDLVLVNGIVIGVDLPPEHQDLVP